MTSEAALKFEEVDRLVAYDPENGSLTWKIDVARNVKAGSPAGSLKRIRTDKKTGKEVKYHYITILRYSIPTARVAWLLANKEWPTTNIVFVDGDPTNLRLSNFKLAVFPSIMRKEGGSKRWLMSKEAQRHYGLKRYYGLTSEQYGQMLADQAGVCSICGEPEVRVTSKGELTTLHVDHDHETNAVRSLLCYRCNSGLGSFRDKPELLRKAAEYLEGHRSEE